MFKIICIDHIVLRTTKLKEMISFYCDTLNCIIDLLDVKKKVNQENSSLAHFCLRISPFNYKDLQKYFSTNNIAIYRHGTRFGATGYGESFYLQDPEGNTIELKEDN
ncbi:hypothetical protein ACNVED_00200 [Legionella sp. D16C41]|uniref:hypothetical protein n=1 Tax=Legionella sp. D16C41 TaxID=3402688 RepID=UPI003AF7F573